jgi:membrane protease YdiL (CAAX protease family)
MFKSIERRLAVISVGEELWWRGYVLPRQELAFGRATWVIHGILWSVIHLFMQPTLWDTVRMQSQVSRSPLLRYAQKALDRAWLATASETWLSS